MESPNIDDHDLNNAHAVVIQPHVPPVIIDGRHGV